MMVMKYVKTTSYERKRKTYLRPVRSLRQTMPPVAKCYCVWSTANCQCLIEEITKKRARVIQNENKTQLQEFVLFSKGKK